MSTVNFNETPPISSYLTCFVVGIFQKLDPCFALSGKVPVSVYSQPDLVKQTAIARDLAAKMLDYFSQYFQIDYPFPKLGSTSLRYYLFSSHYLSAVYLLLLLLNKIKIK